VPTSDPRERDKIGTVQGNGIISTDDDANASEVPRPVVVQDGEEDSPSNNSAQV
jgi:hypothetical protein